MDNKKELERDELHRSIWKIADDLRGAVDGWDFKQYVLGIMFYRYISENMSNYIEKIEKEAGNKSFKYADMKDINQELSDAFERLLKDIPGLCIPDVYTQIGSLDQSVIVSGDMLGVSLDKYLGSNYPPYLKYGYSKEQRETMQRSYIVPDCIGFYLLSLYPMPSDSTFTQQQRDEHIGRIQWVVNRVMRQKEKAFGKSESLSC